MSRKHIALLLFLGILVSAFLIGGVSLLTTPPQPTSGKQEIDVLAIGIKYVEETYGTDYAINGDVGESTYTEEGINGTFTYTYPTAFFRVPADWHKPGRTVNVMVNPETGEIVKVLTSVCKGLPPITPIE